MRLFKRLLVLCLLAGVLFFGWIKLTGPNLANFPELNDGDLAFQTDQSRQMLAILFATGSFYTHVGIIKKDASGIPYVIEAVGPVRKIPLTEWISDGYGERLTIKRMQDLTPVMASNIITAAEKYYGKPYDIYFHFSRESIYCSELVYYAFWDGAHTEIGHLQTVGQLNLDNFAVRHLLESRWRSDPVCQAPDVTSFETCFAKIREQQVITPASLSRDQRLETIYDNYGFLPR